MKKLWGALLCAALAVSLICPASAAVFSDVPDSYWAAEDIRYVTERSRFTGTSATTFSPKSDMSRSMLAVVLYRYAGSPAVSGSVPYSDVSTGQWYTDGVSWAYENGIFPAGTMGAKVLFPGESVRRAEFAIMLYNFAKTLGKADIDAAAMEQSGYTDMDWTRFSLAGFGPIYNEAREAMLGWACPNGIMQGTSANTLSPLATITRAEVAAMLSRFDRNVLGGTAPTAQIDDIVETEPSEQTDSASLTILANGQPATEENVYDILMGLKETYPDGTLYGAPYISTSAVWGPYGRSSTACAGWATLCSDAIFGDLPWRSVSNPDWEEIRPGDLIRFDTETSGHVIVVVKKTDEYIVVTESGLNTKTRWGGQYFRWWLEEQSGYTLRTRYAE